MLYMHSTQIHVTQTYPKHILSDHIIHAKYMYYIGKQYTHEIYNICHTENTSQITDIALHKTSMVDFPNTSYSFTIFITFALFTYYLNIYLPNILCDSSRLHFRIFFVLFFLLFLLVHHS